MLYDRPMFSSKILPLTLLEMSDSGRVGGGGGSIQNCGNPADTKGILKSQAYILDICRRDEIGNTTLQMDRVGEDTFEMYLRYRYYMSGCIFFIFRYFRYRYH